MTTQDEQEPPASARVESTEALAKTESDDPHDAKGAKQDAARTTGRGFLVITGAKAWFFVAAALLNFGLPALFETQAEYGVYGIVINAVSLLNMVVITGSLQAVSKLVSEQPGAGRAVTRRALTLQLMVGLPLAGIWFVLADPVAAWLRDPTYAPLLRVSSLIVAAYAFYAVFVGAFNGLKAFTRQAALDMLFATLRTACILGAVYLGFGVLGAIAGFATAAMVILGVSAVWFMTWSRKLPTSEASSVDGRRLFTFLISIMIYTFVLNAVMRIDLFLLKRMSSDALSHLTDATDASNALAGAYNLALNAARVPYQAVIAIAFVIFPMVSRSTFENDADATKSYITGTMRYSLLITGALSAVLAGGAADIIRPVYPDYAYAADALRLLCIAYGIFALFYIATTVLIAAGHPWVATGATLVTAVAMAVFCQLWIGAAEPGPDMLSAAAMGVLVAMGIGLLTSCGALYWKYKAFLPVLSGIRLTAIFIIIVVVGIFTSFDRFFDFADPLPVLQTDGVGSATRSMLGSRLKWLVAGAGKAVGLGVLYLVLLFVSGEINADDKARLRRVIGRGRGAKSTGS